MKPLLIFFTLAGLTACVNVTERTRDAAIKASAGVGEAVGKTGSEFVKGVKEGIDRTYDCTVVVSEELKKAGITTGKFIIASDSGSATNNKVSVYLIFSKDVNRSVSARITDAAGKEYGRNSKQIKATKEEARFIDFVFDRRTDIESRSVISLQ